MNIVDILPDLKKDEVYLLLLFARNKYLKDKDSIRLGGTARLFKHEIIHKKSDFDLKLKRLQSTIGTYLDQDGKVIPKEAFVTYIKLNPSSMLKASIKFNQRVNELILEGSVNGFKEETYSKIKKLDKVLFSEIQSNDSCKYWIDIDLDIVDKDLGRDYFILLTEYFKTCKFFIVETFGGYHFLILKESMKNHIQKTFYNYLKTMDTEGKIIFGEKFEVKINTEYAIPVPGTYQGDFLVKIL